MFLATKEASVFYGTRFPVLISHLPYTNILGYKITPNPTPFTLPYPVPPLPTVFGVKDPQRANHTAIPTLKIDLNDSEKI